MQMFREIREIESEELVIHVPKAFRKQKVEVIILPLNSQSQKNLGKNSKPQFSREIENFLKLGGSGVWEGNLDEMRETRNGIG
jgi:hypothetical protein